MTDPRFKSARTVVAEATHCTCCPPAHLPCVQQRWDKRQEQQLGDEGSTLIAAAQVPVLCCRAALMMRTALTGAPRRWAASRGGAGSTARDAGVPRRRYAAGPARTARFLTRLRAAGDAAGVQEAKREQMRGSAEVALQHAAVLKAVAESSRSEAYLDTMAQVRTHSHGVCTARGLALLSAAWEGAERLPGGSMTAPHLPGCTRASISVCMCLCVYVCVCVWKELFVRLHARPRRRITILTWALSEVRPWGGGVALGLTSARCDRGGGVALGLSSARCDRGGGCSWADRVLLQWCGVCLPVRGCFLCMREVCPPPHPPHTRGALSPPPNPPTSPPTE